MLSLYRSGVDAGSYIHQMKKDSFTNTGCQQKLHLIINAMRLSECFTDSPS